MAFPFRTVEHTVPCQHIREYPRATADSQEAVLHLAVKQYIPLDNPNPQPGDVTIIGAHANGFPKELYEPLWAELHARQKKYNFRIRGIFIADVAQQGHSGVLNEDKLGNDPSWLDHPRDLLHMINTFRDEMPRPIIGVGHSMGGAHLVNLALMHPRLLTALVLMDPVIHRFASAPKGYPSVAQLSTFRRDVWPSREEAKKSFLKSPFYQAWDPRVFEAWVKHGLRDLPTPLHPDTKSPQVTLTTTKHQEVFTFLRPAYPPSHAPDEDKLVDLDKSGPDTYPFYRPEPGATLLRLPSLRPPTYFILGGDSNMSLPFMRAEKLSLTGTGVGGSGGAAEGKVADIVLEGVGHLVPMEDVHASAEGAGMWFGKWIEEWRKEEEKFWQDWNKVQERDKAIVDEKWEKEIGGPPGGRKKKDAKL